MVGDTRYAVCESIAATVISECKRKGFAGTLEWIGIWYEQTGRSGHSIVVANRVGEINEPDTWGDNYFIVDMWYYNLDMRPSYLIAGEARNEYIKTDITPYLKTRGGPKIMAAV